MHSQRAVDAGNTAERRTSEEAKLYFASFHKWTTEGEGESDCEYPKTQAGVNRKGMIVPVECAGGVIFR